MSNPAARLITLMMLMQRKPNQKAAELAAELGVSVRMLHRYLRMLEDLGIPVTSERGPNGGFSLVRGYKMPPLLFTPEEAVAVCLGTGLVAEMWGRLYQAAARGALAKLEAVLPEESRSEVNWARRSLISTGMHIADFESLSPALETLRNALRAGRRVNLAYHSRSAEGDTFRQVSPLALVHRWGWWYLVAYCHLRAGLRSFRVDRMTGLALTSEESEIPAGFDVQAYLAAEFKDLPMLEVRLAFSAGRAWQAREQRSYWEKFEEQPDGSVRVTMKAPNLEYASGVVLGYGPGVTVLEPQELRRMLVEAALAVAGQYREADVQALPQDKDISL